MDALILGLHLATAHFGAPANAHFQNVNPGIYLRTEQGLTLGAYRNSNNRHSNYVAWTWSTADGRWSITAGAVTGYPRYPVSPLLVPSVRIPFSNVPGGWAARIAYLPKPHNRGASGMHFSVERGW